MSDADSLSRQSEPEDVRLARSVMERHYGDRVLTVSEVCQGIQTWLTAVTEEHGPDAPKQDHRDESLAQIAVAWESVKLALPLAAMKSNLLNRLLYQRLPLSKEKCPEHKGHWIGCPMPGDECPHGCTIGGNTTGWLYSDALDEKGEGA